MHIHVIVDEALSTSSAQLDYDLRPDQKKKKKMVKDLFICLPTGSDKYLL